MAKSNGSWGQIHPNRYLIWACAIALIVAAGLVSYIYIGNIYADIDTATQTDISFWHTYRDANVTLRYPGEWLVDVGPNYVGFGPKNDDRFIFYTYTPANDPAYDSYAKLSTTEKVTVSGIQGIRIPSEKKSHQRIVFVKTTKHLYEFRGTGSQFDQIIQTVTLLKK
jgi:hypothetical protein